MNSARVTAQEQLLCLALAARGGRSTRSSLSVLIPALLGFVGTAERTQAPLPLPAFPVGVQAHLTLHIAVPQVIQEISCSRAFLLSLLPILLPVCDAVSTQAFRALPGDFYNQPASTNSRLHFLNFNLAVYTVLMHFKVLLCCLVGFFVSPATPIAFREVFFQDA